MRKRPQATLKNYATFSKCITKIDGTTIEDAEILDLVMPIEYSSNYPDKTCSLWFYSKDGATNFNYDIENNNAFKLFMYKAKLLSNTVAQSAQNDNDGILKNVIIAVPLKCLSNFLLIN